MCRQCGVTATEPDPVRCTVCSVRKNFEVISPEMLEKIAAVEGGLEEETTYDGRKLAWTQEAKKGLWTMKNATSGAASRLASRKARASKSSAPLHWNSRAA